jgi:ADP-ribose pyrophosphatase
LSNEEKPLGAQMGWQRVDTTYPFVTRWLRLRQDRIDRSGLELNFTYVDGPGAVMIVPVTPSGEIVLIKQYRYTVDEMLVEIPAGGLHDSEDRSPEHMARKELREEIGATCARIEQIGWYYAAVGSSNHVFYVFLAFGVELGGEQELELTEQIETWPVPAAEAIRMARTGELRDGDSALALLLCESRLREEGYL